MPTPASNPAAFFNASRAAIRVLQQRRRRMFPAGNVASSAAHSAPVFGGGVVPPPPPPPPPGGGTGDPGNQGGYGHILTGELHAGTGASASSASASAATAAVSATPSTAATTLSGLAGVLSLYRPGNRRGVARSNMLLLIAAGALCYAWIIAGVLAGQEQGAALRSEGNRPRITIAPDGFALASYPDSLAIATGKRTGAIAQDGRAFAGVEGSTATAYEPAKAAGVAGSALCLWGTRPNGQVVGVIVRPGVGNAAAWTWHTMKNGVYTPLGPVTDDEKKAITTAQEGTIP